ncbi:YlxR family protein [Nocardioides mesophilus]|uniref:YlxR family protein n=1 Tax=Nocardioides mesophilus TaxID=433659 RepID=A0A7G9R9C9_9ACTN|nr:YlxR family protein [Nocardioides mesophilus]QNN52204.1 YlxR family protein [Nocardioides mesophilus]
MPHESVRTCLGCRQRAARHELLRVVAVDEGSGLMVVPDPARRRPGRGAHLHPTPECLALALRRRAFARALRVPGPLASDPLERYLARLGPQNRPEAQP